SKQVVVGGLVGVHPFLGDQKYIGIVAHRPLNGGDALFTAHFKVNQVVWEDHQPAQGNGRKMKRLPLHLDRYFLRHCEPPKAVPRFDNGHSLLFFCRVRQQCAALSLYYNGLRRRLQWVPLLLPAKQDRKVFPSATAFFILASVPLYYSPACPVPATAPAGSGPSGRPSPGPA